MQPKQENDIKTSIVTARIYVAYGKKQLFFVSRVLNKAHPIDEIEFMIIS